MEVICLGKNRKITISATGNEISYCGCEECKAQRSFDRAKKAKDKLNQ